MIDSIYLNCSGPTSLAEATYNVYTPQRRVMINDGLMHCIDSTVLKDNSILIFELHMQY
jgi:hypothetical protein